VSEYRLEMAFLIRGWVILAQNFRQKGASPTNQNVRMSQENAEKLTFSFGWFNKML